MVQQTNNNFSSTSFGNTGALPEQQLQQQQNLIKNFDTMQQQPGLMQPGLSQGIQSFPGTFDQSQSFAIQQPLQTTSFVDQSFVGSSVISQPEMMSQQEWVPQSYLHPQPVEVLTQSVEFIQPQQQFVGQTFVDTTSMPMTQSFTSTMPITQEFIQPQQQFFEQQPLQSGFSQQSLPMQQEFIQPQQPLQSGFSQGMQQQLPMQQPLQPSFSKLDSNKASHPDVLKGSNYDKQGNLTGSEQHDLAINIKPLQQSLTAEERKEVLETKSTHFNVDTGLSFNEAKRKLAQEMNYTVVPVKKEFIRPTISENFGATVQSAKNTVVEGTKSAVNSTVETVKSIPETVGNVASTTAHAVGSTVSSTANVVGSTVSSTANVVGSTVQSAKETIKEAHIPEKVGNAAITTANVVGSTVESAKETIKEAHIPEKLASAAVTTGEVVGTTYENVKEMVKEAHIPEKIAQVASAVASTVGSLAQSALSTAEEVKEEVKETAQEVKEEAKQELKPLTSEIKPLEVKPLTAEFGTTRSIPIVQPKEHSFHVNYELNTAPTGTSVTKIEKSTTLPSGTHVTYTKKIEVQPITSDVKHIPLTSEVKPLVTAPLLSSEIKPTLNESSGISSVGHVTYTKKVEVVPVTVNKELLESEETMEEIAEEVAPTSGWVESAINLASAATHAVGSTLHNAKEMVKEAHIPEKLGQIASSTAQVVGSTLHSTKETIKEAHIPEKVGEAATTTANVVTNALHQAKESAVETAEELAPEAPRSHIDVHYRDTEIVGMSQEKFEVVSDKLEQKLQSGDGAHPVMKQDLLSRGVNLGSESHIDSLKRDTDIPHMGQAKFEKKQEILEQKLEKKEL